jgi:hypothetical protein
MSLKKKYFAKVKYNDDFYTYSSFSTTLAVLTDYTGCHFGKRHFGINSVRRPIKYIVFKNFL